jgi:sugar-phosphatase
MTFVLCDLDGVLVDSGDAIERVWRDWASEQRLDPDAVVGAMHGVPSRQVIERVAPRLDAAREAVRVDALHAATGGRALPGAATLLDGAPPGRLAVVTSCSTALAHARLAAAGLPRPHVLITSEMTARGKPHPDPYLAAAERLSANPADCVVVEDAPAGIRAGRAAGMTVWAVSTTHEPDALAQADRIEENLAAYRIPISLWSPTMNR